MTILDQLADYARVRVNEAKENQSLSEIKSQAEALPKGSYTFEKALRKSGLAIIAEVKQASPSKGIISESFDYKKIAEDYENGGADAISCLTEPKWFKGSDEIFKEIRQIVDLPMLRKDFTVDPYQIYEAKVIGADAVLIIVSLLNQDAKKLTEYLTICDELGLSALVETHDASEIELAISCGARMIGVNNRNLKDFTVNFDNAKDLFKAVPEGVLFVAESGVKNVEDIVSIAEMGADAVLIGEAIMKSPDKKATIQEFKVAGASSNES